MDIVSLTWDPENRCTLRVKQQLWVLMLVAELFVALLILSCAVAR